MMCNPISLQLWSPVTNAYEFGQCLFASFSPHLQCFGWWMAAWMSSLLSLCQSSSQHTTHLPRVTVSRHCFSLNRSACLCFTYLYLHDVNKAVARSLAQFLMFISWHFSCFFHDILSCLFHDILSCLLSQFQRSIAKSRHCYILNL